MPGRRPCEKGGRDSSGASISQGVLSTASNHRNLEEVKILGDEGSRNKNFCNVGGKAVNVFFGLSL